MECLWRLSSCQFDPEDDNPYQEPDEKDDEQRDPDDIRLSADVDPDNFIL